MTNFFAGILIGIGAILPGISSGVFMCCFGLYEKIIDSILHFFKDIKKNLKFLLPIIIGALIGIFIFGNILKIVFNKFYMETSFTFIGLILGSINLVIRQSNIKKANIIHILCLLLTFSFSIYLISLDNTLINFTNIYSYNSLFLAGILMSAGIVIPGVSKTAILIMLGLYNIYLSAISNIDLSILFPLGTGLIIGGIIFLIIINFLFKFVKSYTYFGIIGFIIASIFIIYPGFSVNIHGIISIILLIISFFIGFRLSKYEINKKR